MNTYDVIIVGGGPGGLSAGLYAARRAMKTLILTMDIGGQVATTPDVENYPGFDFVTGVDLSQKMYEQTLKAGAQIRLNSEVIELAKDGDNYVLKTDKDSFTAPTVILAFGKTPRKLGVPGDDQYMGKGVVYCATCDGPLYKNKTIAVVGGGNSAIDAALYMHQIAKKVYVIHRRDTFRGEEIMIDRMLKTEGLEIITDSVVMEVAGSDVVEKVKVMNMKTQEVRDIPVDGVFVEIGFEMKTDFVKPFAKTDESGQILINDQCETNSPGLFAIGDLTPTPYKQIVISAGQGAVAALAAYDYVQRRKGLPSGGTDWGTLKKD
ncbi:MAG: thioredoxin-disulfide reductase [Patescibacteria group bacterium]